jgi:ElaB/YqjD/DUF883 family membrane-anchored ribosome-binding protein
VENELEVIHAEMEETRASLADKLEALENSVRGTVESATHAVATATQAVESTVESVQETVKETVETVKETFDLTDKVERYPWAMFGGAFGVGFLGGCLLGPARRKYPEARAQGWPSSLTEPASAPAAGDGRPAREETGPLSESLHEGLQLLRGMAVGTVMGLLRDMALRAVPPSFTNETTRWMDELTTALGGKPVPRGEAQHTTNGGE